MPNRKWILAVAMALLTTIAAVAQDTAPELKTDKDKLSFALGMNFGVNFRKQGLDLDPAVFAKAFAEFLERFGFRSFLLQMTALVFEFFFHGLKGLDNASEFIGNGCYMLLCRCFRLFGKMH